MSLLQRNYLKKEDGFWAIEQKFYLDTSIWRDYYEDRSDGSKPLGRFALQFLFKTIKDGNLIAYSDFVVEELMIKYSKEEIIGIFSIFYHLNLLVKVPISKEQAKEAAVICKKRNIPFGDVLHAVLARDNKSIMVTRDKHFQRLMDIADIKKPEDLL